MGNVTSTTSATQINNQLMSVVSSIAADAGTIHQGANLLNIGGNCRIIGSNIIQNNFLHVTSNILQDISNSIEVRQKLEAKVKQIAEAEAPNLGLNPGSITARTFASLINNLSLSIQSNISARCSLTGSQINRIDCTGNAEIINSYIQQNLVGKYLFECSQKIDSVIKAQQELQAFIDQHSSAKSVDISVAVLILCAIILCISLLGYSAVKIGGASK